MLESAETITQRIETNEHRVMIGRAECVRLIDDFLSGRLECGVVIEDIAFIRVDMPFGGAGNLRRQRCAGEGMIEVTGLTIENIRVGVRAYEFGNEIGEIVIRPLDTV